MKQVTVGMPLQSLNMNISEPTKPINKHTPFESFLLASTPFMTQATENDTLLTLFQSLESVSDLGVEVFYHNTIDSNNTCDIFLPTLKAISCAYKPNLLSENIETFAYNNEGEEGTPYYQDLPLVDKLNELRMSENSDLFDTPITLITNTSWIAIEWHLHYTSSKFKHGAQKSITVYYGLNLLRPNSYLPVLNWNIDDGGDELREVYAITQFPYEAYQPFDVNMLMYK